MVGTGQLVERLRAKLSGDNNVNRVGVTEKGNSGRWTFIVRVSSDVGVIDYMAMSDKFAEIKRKAELGDVDAQLELADRLFDGDGIEQNKAKAIDLYKAAAEKGNSVAQFELAGIYEEGEHINGRDLEQALFWYGESAKAGYAPAQYALGTLYEEGAVVEKDLSQALHWFQLASDQGDADALKKLGDIFSQGLGVGVDETRAIDYYRKAAANGNIYAKAKLIQYGRKAGLSRYQLDKLKEDILVELGEGSKSRQIVKGVYIAISLLVLVAMVTVYLLYSWSQ